MNFQEKLELFGRFHERSHSQQTLFLFGCIAKHDPKHRSSETSRRTCTFAYTLPVKDEHRSVCKKTLCDILQITTRRVQVVQEKIKTGASFWDMRGARSHSRVHVVQNTTMDVVYRHIVGSKTYGVPTAQSEQHQ